MSEQRALIGKWGIKKWFRVHAPVEFNNAEVGEVPADEPGKLVGRTLEVSLFDLTRDLGHLQVKLKFQINKVESDGAYTVFKSMELTRDYLKSLIRRGSSLIQLIHDVETKDGARLRLTVLAVTPTRCKSSQKRIIRKLFIEKLNELARDNDLAGFVKSVVFGDLSLQLMAVGKRIYPLRKVEVAKVKMLRYPQPPKEIKATAEVQVESRE